MSTDSYHAAAIAMSIFPLLLLLHRRPGTTPRSSRNARDARDARNAAPTARGFTLIELVITIAIVGVLVAVALPTYRDHVRKSRRAEAQAYLMAVAGRQQQFLVDTRSYATALATINIPQPANVAATYDVALVAAVGPPPTFTVTATPKSGTDQTQERCGTLAIDQTGAKTAGLSSCW